MVPPVRTLHDEAAGQTDASAVRRPAYHAFMRTHWRSANETLLSQPLPIDCGRRLLCNARMSLGFNQGAAQQEAPCPLLTTASIRRFVSSTLAER